MAEKEETSNSLIESTRTLSHGSCARNPKGKRAHINIPAQILAAKANLGDNPTLVRFLSWSDLFGSICSPSPQNLA